MARCVVTIRVVLEHVTGLFATKAELAELVAGEVENVGEIATDEGEYRVELAEGYELDVAKVLTPAQARLIGRVTW